MGYECGAGVNITLFHPSQKKERSVKLSHKRQNVLNMLITSFNRLDLCAKIGELFLGCYCILNSLPTCDLINIEHFGISGIPKFIGHKGIRTNV